MKLPGPPLTMDLSDIGIPPTSGTFAIRAEDDSMASEGIKRGDVVLMEKRDPKPGEIVAVRVGGRIELKRLASSSSPPGFEVVGIAVGLIRKL